MKRTELKRKTPMRASRKPMKRGGKLRSKRKPVTKRAKLRDGGESLAKMRFRKLSCVICRALGDASPKDTCWHHIYERSRCADGLLDPANLIPLCPAHHKSFGNICAHPRGGDTFAAARFLRMLQVGMPKRMEKAKAMHRRNVLRLSGHTTRPIDEVEEDYLFWESVTENGRSYEFVCETCDIEPWIVGMAPPEDE